VDRIPRWRRSPPLARRRKRKREKREREREREKREATTKAQTG